MPRAAIPKAVAINVGVNKNEEWGVPVHEDNKLFEFLVLGGFQAGLTWELVLNRRESFRKTFNKFDSKIVSGYSHNDVNRILANHDIIRNENKIKSAITNASHILEIQEEFGSFNDFVWNFVGGKTIHNATRELTDWPCESKESVLMSKELRNRGFKFVGPTICYAFMQATGLINDHLLNCFRYESIRRMCV